MNQPYFLLIALFASLPAVLRVVDHPWNLAPAGAMAMFAGVHLRDKRWAFAVPLLALFASDLGLGLKHHNFKVYTFHELLPVVFLCHVAFIGMGRGVREYWRRIDAWTDAMKRRTASGDAPRKPDRTERAMAALGKPIALAMGTFCGATFFFLVTNFANWYVFDQRTFPKLVECYERAVPFFRNSLMGDAIFVTALFSAYAFVRRGLEAAPGREPEAERF